MIDQIHPENTRTVSNYREFDRRWIVVIFLLIALLVVALLVNLKGANSNPAAQIGIINIDNGDQKINWNRYIAYDVVLGEDITITESGVYHLIGTLSDGAVVINAGLEGQVKLILDNVVISNSNGPAISCLEADDLVIELRGYNQVSDGKTYSPDLDVDIKGAIYSKGDLTFEGEGELSVVANHEDGIIGKDDVKFRSGKYVITAVDDGIRGKDSVYIVGGSFNIESGADSIKSTNETIVDKGFVLIEGGTFSLNSSHAKGIKAINNVIMKNGRYNISTYDDAIHSNNSIQISGGEIEITSSDDGIHADHKLIIDDGVINILRGYEGLEAQVVIINDGKISLFTADDGINGGGGADASSNNRIGANNFKSDENSNIIINGGDIYVNAAGDGIDSNGRIYFNGGKVIIDGPTNDGNGALDSGLGIIMAGGEVIAVGSSGMAVNLGEKSTVYNVNIFFPNTLSAKTKIEIRDSSNNTILEHTPAKTFSHLSAGSNKITLGATYGIYLNGKLYQEFSPSSIVTTIGNPNLGPAHPGRK